jgi:hypothetical protein
MAKNNRTFYKSVAHKQMTLRGQAFHPDTYDGEHRGLLSLVVMLLCLIGIAIIINKIDTTNYKNEIHYIPNNHAK